MRCMSKNNASVLRRSARKTALFPITASCSISNSRQGARQCNSPIAKAPSGWINSARGCVDLGAILRRFGKVPMSGSTLSSAALDERRRRILFRAWRRGLREMDLVMGQFADANLPAMSEAELDEFERLLEIPDPQVLAWITGEEATPPEFDTPLFARLRDRAARGAEREPRNAP